MTFIVQILKHDLILVLLAAFIILPAGLIWGDQKKNGNYTFYSVLILILAMFNVFFGSYITNPIINGLGEPGTAIVTDIEETSSTYNERQVMRHNVLLKTQEGNTVETYFESDDFNIYPTPKSGYQYPQVGVEFAVKYLPKVPQYFIILENAESDYTRQQNCMAMLEELGKAQQKMNFDPTNTQYKTNYENLLANYQKNECIQNLIPSSSFQIQLDPIQIQNFKTSIAR